MPERKAGKRVTMSSFWTYTVIAVSVIVFGAVAFAFIPDRKPVMERIQEACSTAYPPAGSADFEKCKTDMMLRISKDIEKSDDEKRDGVYKKIK